MVHDSVAGTLANADKERIQLEIDKQREMGDDGLLEEDQYLAEVNLEDLGNTNGMKQMYWLLAIQTARKRFFLRSGSPTIQVQDEPLETGT